MESNRPYVSARYAWALTGLLCGLLLAWSLSPSAAQAPTPAPYPETTRLFGPTGRTVGGPGEFIGNADGKPLIIFTNLFGFSGTANVYCATLENLGEVPLTFDAAQGEDAAPSVPVGASMSRCNAFGPSKSLIVTCAASKGKKCRYRWRVDTGGLQN